MTTRNDPPERPEIRAEDDALTAAVNDMTAAIRELTAASQAERRSEDRAILWLSIGLAGVGALAGVLGVVALVGN